MTIGIRSISIFGAQAVGTPSVRLSISTASFPENTAPGTTLGVGLMSDFVICE